MSFIFLHDPFFIAGIDQLHLLSLNIISFIIQSVSCYPKERLLEMSCCKRLLVKILFENTKGRTYPCEYQFHDTRHFSSLWKMMRMFECYSLGKRRVKEKVETPGAPFILGKLCLRKFFGRIKYDRFSRMPFLVLPPCKNL